MNDLSYASQPVPVSDGWETYVYLFQLRATEGLDPALTRPLVLRIYAHPRGLHAAKRECAVQLFLRTRDFPVPQPLWLEQDSGLFGGPFMIVEQVPGQTWVRALLARPCMTCPAIRKLAQLQHRLHTLSIDGFPAARRPFLDRYLDTLECLIRTHDLSGLVHGLNWLMGHAPPHPDRQRIVHMDYHPLNIMRQPDGQLVVLDWPEADAGDHHADVGTSLTLMDTVCLPEKTPLEKLALSLGKFLLSQWYLRAYRELAPLDEDKLRYYRAASALRRLCRYGTWLKAGPCVTGCKPSLLDHLTLEHIRGLQSYFENWTGVKATLE